MTPQEFESLLGKTVDILTTNLRSSPLYHDPESFQQHALDMMKVAAMDMNIEVGDAWHRHAFPDIVANGFGVEVKFTKKDTWTSVGNSIFEGMRDRTVDSVYVIFGKSGGVPEARWGRYNNCVTHVRVSHAPRFVIEMEGDRESLFTHMDIDYDDFAKLNDHDKMQHVRDYSRNRPGGGERLWWIEPDHSVSLEVRPYVDLSNTEKRMLRAEAALLFPQVFSRSSRKYIDVALYFLNHHGVLATNTRDLFTAGSVAGAKGDGNNPKGRYIVPAMNDIEEFVRAAAARLDGELFEEYWGQDYPPHRRISEWLRRADNFAADWKPSEYLFPDESDQ